MAAIVASIVGEGVHRLWQTGQLTGQNLGPRKTPFGPSGDVLLVTNHARPFYLLARYGTGMKKTAPSAIRYRANLYALKDLGVRCVVGWGAGGAIVHDLSVGDIVVLQDVVDRTHQRERTFFEGSPLGYLRQFPVFCPVLRDAACSATAKLKLPHHDAGIAAVSEGPRLETAAEIRMLAGLGATVVTHCFVPEVFLAKELQLCYAALCYVVNYAETGSAYQPFVPGRLFAGASQDSPGDPVERSIAAAGELLASIAERAEKCQGPCACAKPMANKVSQYGLSDDWREWFT